MREIKRFELPTVGRIEATTRGVMFEIMQYGTVGKYLQRSDLDPDDAAKLWQGLRAAWLVSTGMEDLTVPAEQVLDGDSIMGWIVVSTFHDLEHATLHLDNYGKMILPKMMPVEIMRAIR
jgi:hypothetical protein